MPLSKNKDREAFERELAEMRERWQRTRGQRVRDGRRRAKEARGEKVLSPWRVRRRQRIYDRARYRLESLRVGESFTCPVSAKQTVERLAEAHGLVLEIERLRGRSIRVTRLSRNERRAA